MNANDLLARAQRNANLGNFYFARRALTASAFTLAWDLREAVPSITKEESDALALAMQSILAKYRTEAETVSNGEVGKVV
jgi:hypothetical protein